VITICGALSLKNLIMSSNLNPFFTEINNKVITPNITLKGDDVLSETLLLLTPVFVLIKVSRLKEFKYH
jgi:hypothetical protein